MIRRPLKPLRKKSQVTMQFSWIFVVVVGAILLIFFASIVTRQKEASETKLQATVSADLGAILAGAAVSTGTFELIDIPELIINLDCDSYRIGAISNQFVDKIVFGASRLEGEQLITWSLDWNVPYRISNFLFLTMPTMRFFIDTSNDFGEEIFEELPPETMIKNNLKVPAMTKEEYDPGEFIVDKNNFKVRMIFFDRVGDVPPELLNMPSEDLTALVIYSDDFRAGDIEFYEYNPTLRSFRIQPEGESKYIGAASLFGAIFSDRATDYNCLMGKAFSKLSIVSKIYAEREELLWNSFEEEDPCSSVYNPAESSFSTDISDASRGGFERADFSDISNAMIKLESANQDSIIRSCPQLY